MASRIRTIKPEFFLDGELFEAETETGLPLRVAFAGLWCQADRAGRFRWKPRELKLQVLPYDECSFGAVLDALTSRGWLVRYAVDGREYGWVRTFREHQHINNKESASRLPPCPEEPDEPPPLASPLPEGKGREGKPRGSRVADASPTRDSRVADASDSLSLFSIWEEHRGRLPAASGDNGLAAQVADAVAHEPDLAIWAKAIQAKAQDDLWLRHGYGLDTLTRKANREKYLAAVRGALAESAPRAGQPRPILDGWRCPAGDDCPACQGTGQTRHSSGVAERCPLAKPPRGAVPKLDRTEEPHA